MRDHSTFPVSFMQRERPHVDWEPTNGEDGTPTDFSPSNGEIEHPEDLKGRYNLTAYADASFAVFQVAS